MIFINNQLIQLSLTGSDIFEHPTFKDCQMKPKSSELVITHNVSQIVLDRVQTFTDQSIIKVNETSSCIELFFR